jgi:hypothetical protein
MTGKKWFFAQGQRAKSLGQTWHLVKAKFCLYRLPKWAQQALAAGAFFAGATMTLLLARIFGKLQSTEYFGSIRIKQYRFLGKVYFFSEDLTKKEQS